MEGRQVVVCEFVVASGDPSPILEATEHALDEVALPIGGAVVGDRLLSARGRGNHGLDALRGEELAQAVGIIGSVRDDAPDRAGSGQERNRHGEVVDVARGQKQHARPALLVAQGMNLGRTPAPGAAEGLREVPPFAPEAERCALTCVASIETVP